MWLAQILARCPALLQFRHSTSTDTFQSLSVCTMLPHLLHLPWKKASAFSFLDEGLFGRWFLAWILFLYNENKLMTTILWHHRFRIIHKN